MKKLILALLIGISLISLSSAISVQGTDAHGISLSIPGGVGVGEHSGVRILAVRDFTILNVTKHSSTNGDTLRIRNDSNDDIATATFTGDVATFTAGSNNLTAGKYYRIVVSNTGGGFNHQCANNPSLWVNGTVLNWTDGVFNGALNNATYFCNVISIGYTYEAIPSIQVSLNSPANNFSTTSSSVLFNASLIPDQANLTNATIFVWYSNGSLLNMTSKIILGNLTNSTTFNITNIPFGNFLWNVWGNGKNYSGAFLNAFASSNFSFSRQQFLLSNVSYINSSLDTDNQTFSIDLSILNSTSLFSAILVYQVNSTYNKTNQGTVMEISGGKRITNLIDIPKTNTTINRSFSWRFTFDDGSGFTTEYSQTFSHEVRPTDILTSGTPLSINFTIYDEDTLLPRTALFDDTFTWFLGGGTETKQKNFSRSAATSFPFYTSNQTETFYTDSKIQLRNNSVSQDNILRNFDFRLDQLTNISQERVLLIPNLTRTTVVRIEVKDAGLQPLDGAYVTIERFYPGENLYRVVENRKTDLYGQFPARLIENEIRYRATIRDGNLTLLKQTEDFSVSCNTAICFLPFVVEDVGGELEPFENISNYITTMSFNTSTNIFRFTWDDASGQNPIHRLQVTRRLLNGTQVVCNSTSNALQGFLNCNVGGSRASYDAQAFRRVGNKEVRVAQLNYKVGDLSSTFGNEGLFWGFILLFTLIAIGIVVHPIVGVVLYMVGFAFLGFFDIIFVDPTILVTQLVIGVAFIWAFRG